MALSLARSSLDPSSRRSSAARLLLGLVAALSIGRTVRAEPVTLADAEPNDAERLFAEGLQGMRSGDYARGCPKLLASYRLESLPGVLFTLAECEAAWKKFSTALGHYQAFVSALPAMTAERRETFEERRRIAARQIETLSVAAPEITLLVADHHPPGLVVKFDGEIVAPSSYGVGRQVDPGLYAVAVEVDGQPVWARSVTLDEGSRVQLPVKFESPDLVASPVAKESGEADPSRRKVGTWFYVAGGVGVAGLTTGLIAGAFAYGRKSTIDDNCPELECNPNGRGALDSARKEARVSTIGFSFGILGAAAAGALFLFGDGRSHARESTERSSRPRFGIATNGRSISLVSKF